MGPSVRLWVYGTLKKAGRLHGAMAGSTFLGEYRSVAGYILLHVRWYPGLVASGPNNDASSTVAGELYEVPVRMLDHLDQIEGAPLLFRRELILLEGFPEPVETYVYQGDIAGKPVVPNGVWQVS